MGSYRTGGGVRGTVWHRPVCVHETINFVVPPSPSASSGAHRVVSFPGGENGGDGEHVLCVDEACEIVISTRFYGLSILSIAFVVFISDHRLLN